MIGTDPGRRSTERGFSLIEVILAIGLLAGVLISIASMFLLGSRQVKTGKTITEATAICHDIMETFEHRSFTALYTDMGASASDTTKTVQSDVSGSPIEAWQTDIDSKLENGAATVTLTPTGPGTPDFGSAVGIKLEVSLSWNELGRPQTVQLASVRF